MRVGSILRAVVGGYVSSWVLDDTLQIVFGDYFVARGVYVCGPSRLITNFFIACGRPPPGRRVTLYCAKAQPSRVAARPSRVAIVAAAVARHILLLFYAFILLS